MQNLRCVFFTLLCAVSISAQAETNGKDYAVSFEVGGANNLALRKIFNESNSNQFYGEVSFSAYHNEFSDPTFANNSNGQAYAVAIGNRFFLSHDKFSDFIQLALKQSVAKYSNSGNAVTTPGSSYVRTTEASIGYGLEYSLDTHLSIGASAGLQMTYSNSPETGLTSRNINFPVLKTAITYYW